MSNGDKSSKEKYRDKIKRVAIHKPTYTKAELHCIGTSKKPNKLIQNTFNIFFNEQGEKIEGFKRIEEFAERNDMEVDDALDVLMMAVLDDAGEIEENFRKQRLFDNELW